MKPTPQMIEAAARALCKFSGWDPDCDVGLNKDGWRQVPFVRYVKAWEWYEGRHAEAAITAALAAAWQPIESAPKDRYIMISDGTCWPPDVVTWRSEKREIKDVWGTSYHAVPAGWFLSVGSRSRFNPITPDHLMTAKIWCELPEPPKETKG